MDLQPGAKLGPYEILSRLGGGGMGEVWKARDTRLDRVVAIKVSREKFSDRFNREARAVAALNHPNICQLYDVGPDYLVMEFVEGAPVAPVDTTRKLLDIAVQMSEGLAAAHAAGIVHRDLKPDNILITRNGRIKILDFGLAKAAHEEIGQDDATRTIGQAAALTDPGTTVGTIAYMSPEQARGQTNLTAQSDQFSLGLVLYELAVGRRAFQRGSAVETMTAIIREDAEPLPATVPAPLRWIVERLLAKEPAERYDSTRDLYRELRQVRDRLSETVSASGIPVASEANTRPVRPEKKLLAVAFAALFLGGLAVWELRPAVADHSRFTPMEVSLENAFLARWSPDGKAFAYAAGAGGQRRVFLRYLSSPAAKPLTSASFSWNAVGWSADSKRVFALRTQGTERELYLVPVFGGEPESIMPVVADRSPPDVSPDGKTIAIFQKGDDGKYGVYTASPPGSPLKKYAPAPFETPQVSNLPDIQFSPDGRWLTLLVDAPEGRQAWRLPYPSGTGNPQRFLKDVPGYGGTPQMSWFPGGRIGVVSLVEEQGEPNHLWIAGFRSGAQRRITSGASSRQNFPAISPDGNKILFAQSTADYAILSASLSDASVERVISSQLPTGMPAWAARQEKFAYVSERNGPPAIWVRAEGWDRPLVTEFDFPSGSTRWFMTPALSPGADRVIYARVERDQSHSNWISSVSGGPPVRLTNTEKAVEEGGAWSLDGSRFAFIQNRNGVFSLMVVQTGGEATPTVLREKLGWDFLPQWSPDGRWIAFFERPPGKTIGGSWNLISPDGKTVRSLAAANGGEPTVAALTFSADSQRLYGIRPEQDHNYLFSIDIASDQEKIIGDVGKDFTPNSYLSPGVRLSLSPDGKSLLFPSFRSNYSLWMLEGFDLPGWAMQLRERLPW